MAQWLEREFIDRKIRGWNPTSASRFPLSKLGQVGSIPALALPPGGMAVRHRKGATAERYHTVFIPRCQLIALCPLARLNPSPSTPSLSGRFQHAHSEASRTKQAALAFTLAL
ncbi:hypothetical protein CSKR_101672, partial [Clonorchis sinensis]